MYWLPRPCETPSKAMFIVTAQCFLNPLSKANTSDLKILYKEIEAYHS